MLEFRLKADLNGVAELTAEYPEVSREVREAKIMEGLLILERAVKIRTPFGAGPIHLRDSFFTEVNVTGQSVLGIFGNPLEYAEPVEFGTQPHFPPVDPIEFWVEKKLGLSGDEARSAAYAIAWKIAQKGTQGAHMLERGFDVTENQIWQVLSEIPDEIVRRTQ